MQNKPTKAKKRNSSPKDKDHYLVIITNKMWDGFIKFVSTPSGQLIIIGILLAFLGSFLKRAMDNDFFVLITLAGIISIAKGLKVIIDSIDKANK